MTQSNEQRDANAPRDANEPRDADAPRDANEQRDANAPRRATTPRDATGRARDHAAIDRLADDILPDLVQRLTTSGLAEIEVREDDWRVRVRRPVGTPANRSERGDRSDRTRAQESRVARDTHPVHVQTAGSANGNGTAVHAPDRVNATSPAVGVFAPRPEIRPGTRVRAGDRVGTVDLLGVPQDVVAPEDGVVVDTLAEAGEGVEYGQNLVVIEPARGHHESAPPAQPLTES